MESQSIREEKKRSKNEEKTEEKTEGKQRENGGAGVFRRKRVRGEGTGDRKTIVRVCQLRANTWKTKGGYEQ